MCYLSAKEFDKKGCIAVKTKHGKDEGLIIFPIAGNKLAVEGIS